MPHQGRNHVRKKEKVVWKACRGRLAGEGRHCSMGRLQDYTVSRSSMGHTIVLAAEKARVMEFASRGVSLGSEGKLLWLHRNRGRHWPQGAPFVCDEGIRLGSYGAKACEIDQLCRKIPCCSADERCLPNLFIFATNLTFWWGGEPLAQQKRSGISYLSYKVVTSMCLTAYSPDTNAFRLRDCVLLIPGWSLVLSHLKL